MTVGKDPALLEEILSRYEAGSWSFLVRQGRGVDRRANATCRDCAKLLKNMVSRSCSRCSLLRVMLLITRSGQLTRSEEAGMWDETGFEKM